MSTVHENDKGAQNPDGAVGQRAFEAVLHRLPALSLGRTLSVLLGLTVLLALLGLGLSLVYHFREVRLPGEMELESERLARLALEIKDKMLVQTPKSFEANPESFPMKLDALQFPRFPRYGEVFASVRGGSRIRVGGTLTGQIWVDMSPYDLELPDSSPAVYYLMNTFGSFMASSDSVLRQTGKITNRDLVRAFFQSGLDQNVRVSSRTDGDWLEGFRTVPGTNLVLFVEKPLAGVLAPLNRALGQMLFGAFAFALLALLLSWPVFHFGLRPLARIREHALVLKNQRGEPVGRLPALARRSEFADIADAFGLLEGQIKRARGMGQTLVQYVRMLGLYQRASSTRETVHDQLRYLAELAVSLLQPTPQNPVVFVFRDLQDAQGMVFTVPCVQSGGKMVMGEPQPVRDALASQILARYGGAERVEMDQHGVYVPVRAGEIVLGVLVVQRYPNPTHYRMTEPTLTVGLGIFSDRLHALRGDLSGFFEWLRGSLLKARSQGPDEGSDADSPEGSSEDVDQMQDYGDPFGVRPDAFAAQGQARGAPMADPFGGGDDGSDDDDISLP